MEPVYVSLCLVYKQNAPTEQVKTESFPLYSGRSSIGYDD